MAVRFTKRELDIMSVLWARGPSTVAEVREHLEDHLAHNTVLTMFKVMEGKGYVSRSAEGRAHRYAPEVEQDAAGLSALDHLRDRMFGGSPEQLLLQLVDSGVKPDELRRMRDLLNRRLGEIGEDR